MSGFFHAMECAIRDNSAKASLDQMLYYYGMKLELLERREDVYTEVYGGHAGLPTYPVCEFIGIVYSDEYIDGNEMYRFGFNEGVLYTKDPEVRTGRYVKVSRDDGKSHLYEISEVKTLGMTTTIFKSFKLINVNSED